MQRPVQWSECVRLFEIENETHSSCAVNAHRKVVFGTSLSRSLSLLLTRHTRSCVLVCLEMEKIKENTWMLWVKRNRKQMTIRCGYRTLIAIRSCSFFLVRSRSLALALSRNLRFNENVAFNLAWTALTLKPHKSTCDISTCVLEYSVWSWCDTCLPLFIY